jgi:hypothetical protein
MNANDTISISTRLCVAGIGLLGALCLSACQPAAPAAASADSYDPDAKADGPDAVIEFYQPDTAKEVQLGGRTVQSFKLTPEMQKQGISALDHDPAFRNCPWGGAIQVDPVELKGIMADADARRLFLAAVMYSEATTENNKVSEISFAPLSRGGFFRDVYRGDADHLSLKDWPQTDRARP